MPPGVPTQTVPVFCVAALAFVGPPGTAQTQAPGLRGDGLTFKTQGDEMAEGGAIQPRAPVKP